MPSPVKSSTGSVANRCAKKSTGSCGSASNKIRTSRNIDMFDDLSDLYQQVILDHSKSPRNFRIMPNATSSAQGTNPVCGDNYKVFALMDGDVVKDLSFQGSGCAISKASASILTESLKGKTKAEVKTIFDKIHDLVTMGN